MKFINQEITRFVRDTTLFMAKYFSFAKRRYSYVLMIWVVGTFQAVFNENSRHFA